MKLMIAGLLVASLWGCSSPPKAPVPTGEWMPVNTQPSAAK